MPIISEADLLPLLNRSIIFTQDRINKEVLIVEKKLKFIDTLCDLRNLSIKRRNQILEYNKNILYLCRTGKLAPNLMK